MHQYFLFLLVAHRICGSKSVRHDGDPLPASTTPAVCVLSNHGSPLTASPGLPISRWWSRVSPVLSQHCANGKGASSPVHAAVVAPRSDWTALSETSSGDFIPVVMTTCQYPNRGVFVGGWGSRVRLHSCLRWEHDNDLLNDVVTSRLAECFSLLAKLICPACDLWKCMGNSTAVWEFPTSCPIWVCQLNVSHHRMPRSA